MNTDHCDRCHGDGWVLDDDLNSALCDTCDGIPTRAPLSLRTALSALIEAHRGNRSPAYAGALPVVYVDEPGVEL